MEERIWSRMIAAAALLALGLSSLPAAAAGAAEGAISLPGEWNWHDSLMSVTIDFLPNGRYDWDMKTEGLDFPETGVYKLEDDRLTFTRDGAAPQEYQVQRDGTTIVLSGGVFPAPRSFTLAPGSLETVKALQQKEEDDQKAAAAQQAKDDEAWKKKISLAPLNASWHIGAVGEVPADPKPAHRLGHSTVFKEIEGYVRTAVIGGSGPEGPSTYTTRWYFLPNGRFFANWGLSAPRIDSPRSKTWGAYKIVPGGDVDTIQLETDLGEKLALKLEHGRRDLVFKDLAYEQVQAANETLDHLLDSLK